MKPQDGQQPRRAIVTGASRGIGQYIARALAERGYQLLLVARSEAELTRFARELNAAGAKVATAAVDLGRPDAAEQVTEAAIRELGGVDVLVNNAALEPQRRFHALTQADIAEVLQVDLLAPIALTRQLLPGMLAQGYGRIINISSIAGRVGFPCTEAYAASKDGLVGFTRVLRNDYRADGVSASVLLLGAVRDAGIGQRTIDETGMATNTSYMVRPDRVAKAVVRAIEKDRAETVVMKGPGRLLTVLLAAFPGLGGRLNRVSGAEEYMSQVADFRERAAGLTS